MKLERRHTQNVVEFSALKQGDVFGVHGAGYQSVFMKTDGLETDSNNGIWLFDDDTGSSRVGGMLCRFAPDVEVIPYLDATIVI